MEPPRPASTRPSPTPTPEAAVSLSRTEPITIAAAAADCREDYQDQAGQERIPPADAEQPGPCRA